MYPFFHAYEDGHITCVKAARSNQAAAIIVIPHYNYNYNCQCSLSRDCLTVVPTVMVETVEHETPGSRVKIPDIVEPAGNSTTVPADNKKRKDGVIVLCMS